MIHDDDIVVGMRATIINERDLRRQRTWWGIPVTVTHVDRGGPFRSNRVHALTVRYEDRTGDQPEETRRFVRKYGVTARIFRYRDGSTSVFRLVLGVWPEQPDHEEVAF